MFVCVEGAAEAIAFSDVEADDLGRIGARCGQWLQRPGEPYPVRPELSLHDDELMPQRQYLSILVSIAHRREPQQRERVRYSEISQPEQHDRSPWHDVGRGSGRFTVRYPRATLAGRLEALLSRTGGAIGKRRICVRDD